MGESKRRPIIYKGKEIESTIELYEIIQQERKDAYKQGLADGHIEMANM